MSITNLVRDYGVEPCIVRMLSTDTYSEITTTGYLSHQMTAFNRINGGSFQWAETDVILANYNGGWAFFTISSDFNSLIPFSGIAPVAQPSSVLVTDVDSNELWQGPLTDGQLIVGVTGGTPVNNQLIAGDNVTIDIAPGTITINATGGGGGGVTSTQVQRSAFNYAAGTYSAGNYTVTLSPAVTVLTDGLLVTMIASDTNATTSPTLQLNALSPKPIVSFEGSPAVGDILADSAYLLVYSGDNDNFQLLNPSLTAANSYLVQKQYYNFAPDIGSANAYVANLALPPLVALSDGVTVYLQVANTNTGASTLVVNGSSAAPIVSLNGSALTGGEIVANSLQMFMYSSVESAFVLMTPYLAPSSSGVTSITGTANQVIASSSTGDIILSLPQDIATTSSPIFDAPTFTAPTLGVPASGNLVNCTNLSVPDGLNASGTPGATTFLRGDGNWAVPSGTGVASVSGTLNRITSTGGTNPVIDISASYVGQSSITTLGTVTAGTWNATTIDISYGGTGVTSVTTTPAATAWAGWDSNENLSANNYFSLSETIDVDTQPSHLVVLDLASPHYIFLTGSVDSGVVLPDNTTLPLGYNIQIINNTSADTTVAAADTMSVVTIHPGQVVQFESINNAVDTNTSWIYTYISGSTSVQPGNINDLAYYAATGSTVSPLSTANNGLLVTSSSGTPSIGNAIGADITISQSYIGIGKADDIYSVVFGNTAGNSLQSGATQNILIGAQAGLGITTGSSIISIGYQSLFFGSPGGDLVIGNQSCFNSGGNNLVVGHGAMTGNVSGSFNTGIGNQALNQLSTSNYITAIGFGTGTGGTVGAPVINSSYHVLIGYEACIDNDSTSQGAIAIGANALAIAASGNYGQGISIGSPIYPVGTDSTAKYFTSSSSAGYWRPVLNGTAFLMPLFVDGTFTDSSVMITDASGTPTLTPSLTDGQIVIGSSTGLPAPANLNAGTGISITNAANSVTISSTASGFPYVTITGTTQNADVNHGYIPTNSALTTINLPATCVAGDKISIRGYGTGGWMLQANTGQTIAFGQLSSTVAGSFASTYELDTIDVVCLVDNTFWTVEGAVSAGLTAA